MSGTLRSMPPTDTQRLAQQQRPSGLPVMKQRWNELGFFHWPVDPELIAKRLPPGLHVDTFGGKAWLGIVPFLMQCVRPIGLPPLPWLSWFHELNLRTYVHDDSGKPGVWFFSLDCDQPIAVEIARKCFNLPYQHARMSSALTGDQFTLTSQRKGATHPSETFSYPRPEKPKPADFGTLEWFLVERYTLFSADTKGGLYAGRVHHAPYQIQTFAESPCPTHLFTLNGFPQPSWPPDSILSARPVDVTIFPIRKIS